MTKRLRCSDCSCCTTDKVFGICFECGDHAIPNCDWHGCPDLIAKPVGRTVPPIAVRRPVEAVATRTIQPRAITNEIVGRP